MFFLLPLLSFSFAANAPTILYTDCSEPIIVKEASHVEINITLPSEANCEISFEVTSTSVIHWMAYSYNANKGDSLLMSDYTGYNVSIIPTAENVYSSNLWFYVTTNLLLQTGNYSGAHLAIQYYTETPEDTPTEIIMPLSSGNYVLASDLGSNNPITVTSTEPFSMIFIEGYTYSVNVFAIQGDYGSDNYLGRLHSLQADGRIDISTRPFKVTIFKYTEWEMKFMLLGRTNPDIAAFSEYNFFSPFTSHSPLKTIVMEGYTKPAALTVAGPFGFWMSEGVFLTNTTVLSIFPAVKTDNFPPLASFDFNNNSLHHLPQFLAPQVTTLVLTGGSVTFSLIQPTAGTHTNFSGAGSATYWTPFYQDLHANGTTSNNIMYRKRSEEYYDLELFVEDCDMEGQFDIHFSTQDDGYDQVSMIKNGYKIIPNISTFSFRYSYLNGNGGVLQYTVAPTGTLQSTTILPTLSIPKEAKRHNFILFILLFLLSGF